MVRAVHTYNADVIHAFIDEKGLTHRELADACGVSEKHIGDVLNERTVTCKAKTKRKFTDGFRKLGMSDADISRIFTAG